MKVCPSSERIRSVTFLRTMTRWSPSGKINGVNTRDPIQPLGVEANRLTDFFAKRLFDVLYGHGLKVCLY